MRGKKIDSEFISEFISNCVTTGIDTPEKISSHAKKIINDIDEEIKKIEKQKVYRSKLLDVLSTFDKPIKNKPEEIKILSLYKIQNQNMCNEICKMLKDSVIAIDVLQKKFSKPNDVMFSIKQLIENKVVHKLGQNILRGENFEEYLKFVLKD
jgi:hypothetical protein